jgi:nucleotide-binding universal stress UspA family protein
MFKKILVPLDCSPLAERALAHVQRFSAPGKTEVVLVSAIEPWRYYSGATDIALPAMLASIRATVEEYLVSQSAQLRSAGYATSTYLVDGDAAGTILELAQEVQADLIAMSTHGRSGVVRWALGSVAERVIQGSTVPILLVRQLTPLLVAQPMRILVPLDGSRLAEQALPHAQAIAGHTGATLLLLYVLQSFDEESLRLLFDNNQSAVEAFAHWQEDAGAYLRTVAKQLRAHEIRVDMEVSCGEADKVICEVASQEDIGLIVMSTHGRSGLSRWVYGSVANKVLRGVECPLILIRGTPTQEDESDGQQDEKFTMLNG